MQQLSSAHPHLIIGQGLAGSMLAWYLLQAGQRVLVVDKPHPNSASQVSSGIMNPVTGRRLVKTWMAETLFPFAFAAYTHLEEVLGETFLYRKPIIWQVNSYKEINQFSERQAQIDYTPYIKAITLGGYAESLHSTIGYATISGGRVDTVSLTKAIRAYLVKQGALVATKFEYDDLELHLNGAKWKGKEVATVIFCEGYRAIYNPYFNYLPFNLNKGEILTIEAPSLQTNGSFIKNGKFLIPLNASKFWLGATYNREEVDECITPAVREKLTKQLQKMIQVPYTVTQHRAGIRPCNKHRRPFLGRHPVYKQLAIFNGLGTKGVTLAPYFAQQMTNFLLKNDRLLPDVNIEKYDKLYSIS